MRTIWKYDIPVDGEVHEIHVPGPAHFRHADVQNDPGVVSVWFEVESEGTGTHPIRYTVIGTGHKVPGNGRYVRSMVTAGGALVWHLYEIVSL